MVEKRTNQTKPKPTPPRTSTTTDSDLEIIRKVRLICSRGNNAEIKQRSDGTLTVMEVKKNIV